jgi:hypothetical protein
MLLLIWWSSEWVAFFEAPMEREMLFEFSRIRGVSVTERAAVGAIWAE